MDTIDKWLKSLRLHKYSHLFKTLTYEQMLNLEEKYLIEKEVTKGARNKMLVSIKKLNLRQERLTNMIDDLNQDNISMKEALTVLKDMLLTPIPPPNNQKKEQNHSSNYLDPYELTHLFIYTLEKVARRLIESASIEDNACHGIMAAIVDECLKHNSFTKEQKAIVVSFKHHFTKEQKAKVASFKQQLRHQQQHHRPHSYNHHPYHHPQHQYQHQQQQQQGTQKQQQQEHLLFILNHHHHQYQLEQQHQFHHDHNNHYHYLHSHWDGPIQQPPSLSASLSTIGSTASTTSDEEERQTYKEYSLLGPGKTFELPCLRALAASDNHNRRQLSFLSVFQSKSSC